MTRTGSFLQAAGAGILLTLAGPALAVDLGERNIAGKTEIVPIGSVTLTDQEFLTGQPGTPATIAAELRLPPGAQGALPAVIVMHPGGGILAGQEVWAREFTDAGFAVFLVDGFSGRGMPASNGVVQLAAVADLYAALGVLARHPRIDPARIVALGFSWGARATLFSALARFDAMWNRSGAKLAAHIAFYPDCSTSYADGDEVLPAPILILGGGADTMADMADCTAWGERLSAAGADVDVVIYPDAPHGFGDPLLPPRVELANLPNARDCDLAEGEAGALLNTATGEPFTMGDACVVTGASLGSDRAAFAEARTMVLDLAARFGPPD